MGSQWWWGAVPLPLQPEERGTRNADVINFELANKLRLIVASGAGGGSGGSVGGCGNGGIFVNISVANADT